jgi:hypothetical protein
VTAYVSVPEDLVLHSPELPSHPAADDIKGAARTHDAIDDANRWLEVRPTRGPRGRDHVS